MAMTIMISMRVNPDEFLRKDKRIISYCQAIVTICMIAQNIAIANQSTNTQASKSAMGSIYFTIFARAISTSRLYWTAILSVMAPMVDVRSALSIICMISGVKKV
jgi:hypothetical protein